MALINIEYGSLASSETMNSNFLYLDEKIATTSESILTSISSILSNIATINGRLNELSDDISDTADNLDAKIEGYKTKTKLLVSKAVMVPDWELCEEITLAANTNYTAPSNGYVLIMPEKTSRVTITVNGSNVPLKNRDNTYDNSMQLLVVPLCKGDKAKVNTTVSAAYFLPVLEVSVEDF